MLEHEEGDQSGHEEDEKGNVGVDGDPVQEEPLGIFKEDALQLQFVAVEEHHAEAEDGQEEADYCDYYLPAWVVAVETLFHHMYAELATRIIMPRAIKQTAAAMGAILGTSLGTIWTTAIHNSPSPSAVTMTIQKALRNP